MARINQNYDKLGAGYLFPEIARRARAFAEISNPGVEVLRLGIGDTTLPLTPTVVAGLHAGAEKLGSPATYTGYGDYEGETVHAGGRRRPLPRARRLPRALRDLRQRRRQVRLRQHPVDLLHRRGGGGPGSGLPGLRRHQRHGRPDRRLRPGHRAVRRHRLHALQRAGTASSPSCPSGRSTSSTSAARTTRPARWPPGSSSPAFVDYAAGAAGGHHLRRRLLGLHPRPGVCPTASTRCRAPRAAPSSSTASPSRPASPASGSAGRWCRRSSWPRTARPGKLNAMWYRRQTPSSTARPTWCRPAARPRSRPRGRASARPWSTSTWTTPGSSARGSPAVGLTCHGGDQRALHLGRTPGGARSWDFFDRLLREAHVVTTPGSGFGPSGEGYIRLSAFGKRGDTERAVERIRKVLG